MIGVRTLTPYIYNTTSLSAELGSPDNKLIIYYDIFLTFTFI
jgi:hypothetical protein